MLNGLVQASLETRASQADELELEMQKLTKQVKVIRERVDFQNVQKNELEIQRIRTENATLKNELHVHTAHMQHLQESVQSQQEEIEQLRLKERNLRYGFGSVKLVIFKQKQSMFCSLDYEESERKCSVVEAEIGSLNSSISEMKELVETLQKENSILSEDYSMLQEKARRDVEAQRKLNEEALLKQILDVTENLDAMRAERNALRAKVSLTFKY